VDLSWTDASGGETGYDIYRAAGAGGYVRIAHDLPANSGSYQDTGASAGTSYSYQVVATNATGASSPATQSALTIPGQPQSFQAVAASASQIDLTWNQVTGATEYTVQRSPNGTDTWTQVGQVNGSTLGIHNTGLSEGTFYYYMIVASNSTGPGQAATANTATLPSAVTNLMLSSSSPTAVHLSWTDTSVGATGYTVYRSDDSRRELHFAHDAE